MINIKSFLIHILYRSFLSIQKIQNLNLKYEKKSNNINNCDFKKKNLFYYSIADPMFNMLPFYI